jgi:glycosyltransferase involved in cell wall biosynthesis
VIAYVTPDVSASPRSGGALRSTRLLQALTEDHEVHVLLVHDDVAREETLAAVTGAASARVFPRPHASVGNRVRSVTRRWPLWSSRIWTEACARHLAGLVDAGATVVLDQLRMAPYRPSRGRYVVSVQNAEASLLASMPPPTGLLRRIEHRIEVAAVSRQEREVLADPRAELVVVSEADALLLGHGHVVRNGTDIPATVSPRRADGSVLFIGSTDYPPNADAVRWWSEEIAAGTLTVVGRYGAGSAALGRLPHVDLVGEVEDVHPYLADASCVVVPLRHGGGTRLKILEALAWRRPVITTSKGAEGLPVRDGVEVLIADGPAAFAAAIARVHDDPALVERLADAGAEVAAAFAWPVVAEPFVGLVADLVKQ